MSTISNLAATTGILPVYQTPSRTNAGQSAQGSGVSSAHPHAVSGSNQGAVTDSQDDSSDDSNTPDTTSTFTNSQANADYKTLLKDFQSGNLTEAQKDESKLQTDLKATASHSSHHRVVPSTISAHSTSASSTSVGNYVNVTV